MKLLLLLILYCLTLPTVNAASFDCAKLMSATEKLICSDVDLSKLDETLSQSYKHAIEAVLDKSSVARDERLWIRNVRNTCQDAACLKLVYQKRISQLALIGNSLASKAIDGDWKVIWSCKGATGQYAERCKQGVRDYFELYLWSTGERLCGVHTATAQFGNVVDEDENTENPSLTGIINNSSADVTLGVTESGPIKATIKVVKDKLLWSINNIGGNPNSQTPSNRSWIVPNQAILIRQIKTSSYQKPAQGCL